MLETDEVSVKSWSMSWMVSLCNVSSFAGLMPVFAISSRMSLIFIRLHFGGWSVKRNYGVIDRFLIGRMVFFSNCNTCSIWARLYGLLSEYRIAGGIRGESSSGEAIILAIYSCPG